MLLFFVFAPLASARTFPDPVDSYVNDFAGIFSPAEAGYLGGLFYEVERNTTAQVVVITINNSGGYDLSQYATEIGQAWGVGNKGNNNGLVILYSANEEKIFAAVGYGLEGILPDSKIGRLLDENYVPLRDAGNITTGILRFADAVSQVIEQNAEEVRTGATNNISGQIVFGVVAFVLFLGLFAFFFYLFSKRKKKGFGDFWSFFFADFLARLVIATLLGGRRRTSSGFGGGGGFGGGFGGGSFGGGGAGR